MNLNCLIALIFCWAIWLTLCWLNFCLALILVELDIYLVNTIGFMGFMKFELHLSKWMDGIDQMKFIPWSIWESFSLHVLIFISFLPLPFIGQWLLKYSNATWFINDHVSDESTLAWLGYVYPLLFLCVVCFRSFALKLYL